MAVLIRPEAMALSPRATELSPEATERLPPAKLLTPLAVLGRLRFLMTKDLRLRRLRDLFSMLLLMAEWKRCLIWFWRDYQKVAFEV